MSLPGVEFVLSGLPHATFFNDLSMTGSTVLVTL